MFIRGVVNMNNKGFGLVSVLAIFLVLTVLIASLMTMSKVQSLQVVNNTVEDRLELTAKSAIDMVAAAIVKTQNDGYKEDLVRMIPTTIDQSYNVDIAFEDSPFGTISDVKITRTMRNIAIISLTASNGNIEYDLRGVMVKLNSRWEFRNYAK